MRRFAIVLGLTAALAAATAAPAAAHTITPTSFDFGNVSGPKSVSAEFTVTAVGGEVSGRPDVVSGDSQAFRVSSTGPASTRCSGTLDAGESCVFSVSFDAPKPGTYTYGAVVGMSGGPTATVAARTTGASSGKGSKKSCKKGGKKKGKKGATAAKKKKKGKYKGKKGATAAKKKKGCKKKGKKK